MGEVRSKLQQLRASDMFPGSTKLMFGGLGDIMANPDFNDAYTFWQQSFGESTSMVIYVFFLFLT
eukprot:SAG11_NODE_8440_length_1015_cov_1.494541_1_plen_64_part_10